MAVFQARWHGKQTFGEKVSAQTNGVPLSGRRLCFSAQSRQGQIFCTDNKLDPTLDKPCRYRTSHFHCAAPCQADPAPEAQMGTPAVPI